MPDLLALLVLPALVLGAAGVLALRAVLAGRALGVPASIAVLGPASEAARAARSLPLVPRGGAAVRLGAVLLLVAAAFRVLLLPLDGGAVLGTPLGVGALVLLDLVGWACWWAVDRSRGLPLKALALELPVVVALAAPVVAAGGVQPAAIAAAQRDLPFVLQMPAVALVLLAVPALLVPWSAATATPERLVGLDRLLVGAARAASLVAAAWTAATLLLGGGPVRVALATAVLLVVVEVVARRLPVLRAADAPVAALLVLLPVAALQLAVVVAIALLARA